MGIQIPDVELVQGGGGEANSTQRLRKSLTDRGWTKRRIVIRKIVDNIERAAISHEIDHVRKTDKGSIGLEIEWNNKGLFASEWGRGCLGSFVLVRVLAIVEGANTL